MQGITSCKYDAAMFALHLLYYVNLMISSACAEKLRTHSKGREAERMERLDDYHDTDYVHETCGCRRRLMHSNCIYSALQKCQLSKLLCLQLGASLAKGERYARHRHVNTRICAGQKSIHILRGLCCNKQ